VFKPHVRLTAEVQIALWSHLYRERLDWKNPQDFFDYE
jgi:hypothetical protein